VLYAVAFDRVGVVVSDLYFLDPAPEPGQEGAEQGVRLEVRVFERGPLHGSIYSAQPIAIDQPIWRADLLESVANPGSLDRAHHHPRFRDWEPGSRRFDEQMTADPVGWVGTKLSDLARLLAEAGVPPDAVGPADAADLRAAVPEIVGTVRTMLDRIRAGQLARPTEAAGEPGARSSWL
jgi:hypothetical protein